MKKILGLDLGSNSIGWALIENDFDNKEGRILGMGSRIIPMSQDMISDFDKGNTVSQTADRTKFRGIRRLRERYLLRRQRLHRVLKIMGFLPSHYAEKIDFENRKGQFIDHSEPKLAYNNNVFYFKNEFNNMLEEFKAIHPNLLQAGKKIPYDWTIYYLRKEATRRMVSKEAIAWILLQFNQKRGYNQLRGEEEEEQKNKKVEFHALRVVSVTPDEEPNRKGDIWYNVSLENGWVYRRKSNVSLDDWIGKVKEFIVTTDMLPDNTEKLDKEGNVSRSFRAPKDDDWGLIKKKTESELDKSGVLLGEFIYNNLLKDPTTKIIGSLIRTIEREFYKEELKQILNKQAEYHKELQDKHLLNQVIEELYSKNTNHKELLINRGWTHLFVEDILYYQRPLRSQKSSIANCPFELRKYKKDGQEHTQPIKVCSKSHPIYQEFRVLQWLQNLRIFDRVTDAEITTTFLNTYQQKEDLLQILLSKNTITQSELLKALGTSDKKARWNYVEDKAYPMAETVFEIRKRLSKVEKWNPIDWNDQLTESLWHIIYSVTDKGEYEKALTSFAQKNSLEPQSFLENFKKFPPFKSDYGSFSLKAIKKLLTLMRFGNHWDPSRIDTLTYRRIEKIISAEFDDKIDDKIRDRLIDFDSVEDFQDMPVWLASYVIYGRHSEASEFNKWHSSSELDEYIRSFKQHSLRNPIVEQVILECLRVVRDIWDHYGKGQANYFDEIHLELARELKKNSEERKRLSENNVQNELTNLRIKYLLAELSSDSSIQNVRAFSPIQQEKLKLYEEGILNSSAEIPDDISKMLKTPQPTSSQLKRYKLWLEQGYRSPYSGIVIPLSKLFTTEYEIEHIIPQSRFFDDSLSNKIICETALNKLKDNQLGLEFIKNHGGQIVQAGMGQNIRVFTEEEYKEFVTSYFKNNYQKRKKLLLDEIPKEMAERQLNDTRYISKHMMNILSPIVRAEKDDDGFNSKNVVATNGSITNILKNDWGLNDVWNDLILPRFERLNEITGTTSFTTYNQNHQKFLPTVPLELSRGFNRKRIDHRHHALDALVVAATTRSHINYLNNQNSKSGNQPEKFALLNKLRRTEDYHSSKTGRIQKVGKEFLKPWKKFTADAAIQLQSIIVSFKQNIRVINKSTNFTQQWQEINGQLKKGRVRQTKGANWAIRKSLHKDTVAGLVKIRKPKEVNLSIAIDQIENLVDKAFKSYLKTQLNQGVDKKSLLKSLKDEGHIWEGKDVKKVAIWYWEVDENGIPNYIANRVKLDESFDEKKIATITDTGIQKILLNHLEKYRNRTDESGKPIKPETLAFSVEGLTDMNQNIIELNNGKNHMPIFKVRTMEIRGNKFPVGYTGNKNRKYVEAAKGTNLFFAIYQDQEGKRYYETIQLNMAIERMKQGLEPVPQYNMDDIPLLFQLSPNDIISISEDYDTPINNNESLYKVVSFSENRLFAIPNTVAKVIFDKVEYTTKNKLETTNKKFPIKSVCTKINVNRIGKII